MKTTFRERSKRARREGWHGLLALLALTAGLSARSVQAASRDEGAAKAPFAAQFAIADFDGDEKPDLASVRAGAGGASRVLYLIDFRLSTGTRHTYRLEGAAGGVRLTSRDVNGDRLLDLVVTSSLTGEPLAVFLNDGRGNFTRSEPAAYPEAYRQAGRSLSTADAGNDDRSGAEVLRSVPAGSESVKRFEVDDGRRLLMVRDFCTSNGTSQPAWLGRAPPDRVLS